MKKGHLPSLLSPEIGGILFRNPSNNIPKIILMIDDPVIDLPSSLFKIKPMLCNFRPGLLILHKNCVILDIENRIEKVGRN